MQKQFIRSTAKRRDRADVPCFADATEHARCTPCRTLSAPSAIGRVCTDKSWADCQPESLRALRLWHGAFAPQDVLALTSLLAECKQLTELSIRGAPPSSPAVHAIDITTPIKVSTSELRELSRPTMLIVTSSQFATFLQVLKPDEVSGAGSTMHGEQCAQVLAQLTASRIALERLEFMDCHTGRHFAASMADHVRCAASDTPRAEVTHTAFFCTDAALESARVLIAFERTAERTAKGLKRRVTAHARGCSAAQHRAAALTALDISGSSLRDGGAARLAHSLAICGALQHVAIADCGIQDAALASFARLLQSLPALGTLDMSGNTVGGRSCQALEQCLQGASTLTALRLDRCGIHDQEGAALAATLCARVSLKHISLAGPFCPWL